MVPFVIVLGSTAAPVAEAAEAAKPNQAPSVSIASPANNATFAVGATVNFTATASDPDGSVAKVEYFRGGTIPLGTASVSPYAIPVVFNVAGPYSITAKATDNLGLSKTSTAVVINVGATPVVAITAPASGATFSAPATIAMTASASDADGTVTRVDFLQGATLIGSATTPPFLVTWSNVPTGSYTLTAKATDNSGATSTSAAVPITVGTTNLPPLVVLTAPDSCIVYDAPAIVALLADAVDPDGSIARVDFLQGSTVIGSSTAPPYSATWTSVAAGTYTLTARATDARGGTEASPPVTVVVRSANMPPTATLTSPTDGAVFNAPASIPLAAVATDADGSVAKVEFVVDGAVVASATVAPYQSSWTGPPTGTHQLLARATDAAGSVGNSAPVRITVNGPPVVQITSPAAGASFVAPAAIPITASASAVAGAVVKLEFFDGSTLVGTVNTSGTPVSATFNYGSVGAGSHDLTVRATDAAGMATVSAARTVSVNAVPTVALVAPLDNASFGIPGTIALSADASITYGAIAKVDFLAGNSIIATSTQSPYTAIWANPPAGIHVLTARATSSAGLTASSGPRAITVSPVNFAIESPQSSATVFESNVVVNGSFSGVTIADVTVNGVRARIGNRTFAVSVPLAIGNNVLPVVANTSSGLITRAINVNRSEPAFAITNVANGQTIEDDTVTLVGTAAVPPNSAIIVNDQLATLTEDGTFFVNNLSLMPGANAIPVVLVTPELARQASTNAATASKRVARKSATDVVLDLNRSGIAPFSLEVGNATGFAPLTVDVTLKNRLAYVYDQLTIDIDGNGAIDYAEQGLPVPILERDFQVTYSAPGVYPMTLTLTRQNGAEIIYRATRMIHVQSVPQAADTLRNIFRGMLSQLAAGDITSAATWLTSTIRDRYTEAFNRLAPVLPQTVESIGTVEEATLGDGYADLSVVRNIDGVLHRFSVLMIRDGDGLWRIDGM